MNVENKLVRNLLTNITGVNLYIITKCGLFQECTNHIRKPGLRV